MPSSSIAASQKGGGKKESTTRTSTKLASRAPRHRRVHRPMAASAMPVLPTMERQKTAA